MKLDIGVVVVMVIGAAACGGSSAHNNGPDASVDAVPPDAAPQFAGDVTGADTPAEGTVFVVWIVSSGSPDYLYKFGDGTSVGGHYTASLSGPLPADAINADGVAIGVLGLAAKGAQIPDGRFMESQVMIIGASQGGLVYRAASSQTTGWRAGFPAGQVSCARCVPATTGGNDTMEPAPCAELSITASPDAEACNSQ